MLKVLSTSMNICPQRPTLAANDQWPYRWRSEARRQQARGIDVYVSVLLTPLSFDRWHHSKTFSSVNQRPTLCLLNLLNYSLHRCKLANESLGWLNCHLLSATLHNTLRLDIAVDYSSNCSLVQCCFSRVVRWVCGTSSWLSIRSRTTF